MEGTHECVDWHDSCLLDGRRDSEENTNVNAFLIHFVFDAGAVASHLGEPLTHRFSCVQNWRKEKALTAADCQFLF